MAYSKLDLCCTAHGYASAATLANGPYCVTNDNQFVPINMNDVCRYAFPAYPHAVLQSYNITVIDICRVVDGRIVEHWGVPDRFAILAQAGALDRLT